MNHKKNQIFKYILVFLAIFIPFREIISYYTNSFIKFIPDLLIFGMLGIHIIKNKFKITLKLYDVLFVCFIMIGLISCIINSVSLLAFALQVRSIGTMYVLFYLLRSVKLERGDYQLITKVLVIVNSIIIVISCFEILSNKILFFPKDWSNSIIYESNFSRAYSLLNNPNTFAMFTFINMLLLYFQCDKNIEKKHVIFYFLALLGILLSASRSTFIVVCIFFCYILLRSINQRSMKNFIIMMVVFALSFSALIGIDYVKNCNFCHNFIIKVSDKLNNTNNTDNTNKTQQNNQQQESKPSSSTPQKPEESKPSSDSKPQQPNNQQQESKPSNNNTSEKENSSSGIAILDRLQETTSGTTSQYSKIDGRIARIKKGFEIFKDYPIIGTGFGTYGSAASRMVTPKLYEKYGIHKGFYTDNEYIKVIVETGIIGSVVYGLFCLALLYSQFKKKNDKNIFFLLTFLLMGMFYNIFEVAPLCFVAYILLAIMEENNNCNVIDKNKISILSLHLGFGGVEQVVVNTANMLCDKYDVEIISLYKNKEKIPFDINEKVKITYLTKTISNRKEFKTALKEKKLLNIIKEGIKAVYILAIKDSVMIDAIKSSHSKIIISTRYSFSKLLNEYGSEEQYKIHQEHTYSISEEYINNLNKLKEINCIMPASQTLYEKYYKKVNAKLVYIPFVLNYYPKDTEISKLNTKNLIAIGRLEQEKGFDDLLNIISKLNDKEIFLNLFGDGSLMNQLKNQAKELGIDKQVKFWGFKNQDFIKKYMLESSLYVMTSHEESFGLVLIEAMSFGIPCIAYDSAEGAKYTINNENGFFIKNRNEVEMIKTIKSYLKLPSKEKIRMGKAAKKVIETYEYDTIKKKILNFTQDILEEKI